MASVRQGIIAKKLNLSIATVSRSLSNHPAISVETRARVLQIAKELGYQRGAARDDGRDETGHPSTQTPIGVLVGIQPNSSPLATFPLILKGIQDRARIDRVPVEVSYQDPIHFNPEARSDPVMRQIRERKWQGIVLIYSYLPKVVEALAHRIPLVSTLEEYEGLSVDSIDTNHHTGVVAMVNRLAAMGHRKIGFITWAYPMTGHWSLQRFSAYVASMFANGLEFRLDQIFNVHKSAAALSASEIADQAARKVREDGVTAWVCAADHQAYQLIMDLQSRGIQVPAHCSVTGFDGIAPPHLLKQVTSQRVPNEAIGSAAVVRLLNRIAHPKAHRRRILVETEFVEGATIAPPPKLFDHTSPTLILVPSQDVGPPT